MGLREKAMELALELKRTDDFAELKQAKAAIDKYPALKQELESFNKSKHRFIRRSRLLRKQPQDWNS